MIPDRGHRAIPPSDLQDRQDRELLAAAAAGDEEAFMVFYRRYSSTAMGLAVRVLRDRALAEEVLQEVFVEVWKKAGRFDPARGNARSWLLAQVHHRSVDAVRREDATKRRERAERPGSPVEDPEAQVVHEDWLAGRRVQVRAALEGLPDTHRQVLELAYFQGKTQREVAEDMQIPLGTVKTRTLHAMRKLRATLEGAVT